MRENRTYGSEGGGAELNRSSRPLSFQSTAYSPNRQRIPSFSHAVSVRARACNHCWTEVSGAGETLFPRCVPGLFISECATVFQIPRFLFPLFLELFIRPVLGRERLRLVDLPKNRTDKRATRSFNHHTCCCKRATSARFLLPKRLIVFRDSSVKRFVKFS